MASGLELTVGQVSGIIAAGVVVVKFFLPSLLALLFLGTLKKKEPRQPQQYRGESGIGRLLHSSYWPTILNSDSSASSGVSRPLIAFRYAGLLSTVLLSIAAIVTPLGLFEAIVDNQTLTTQPFHYIQDGDSVFQLGTPRRNESVAFSRVCGGTCPDLTRESSNGTVDRTIPQATKDLLSSGLSSSSDSTSSMFDIEWRSWSWTSFSNRSLEGNDITTSPASKFDAVYPIGLFHQISTLALDDKYEVIEGLVVDAKNGGIGFRNHSAPPLTPHGSAWTEDLLFIQPLVSCVNTNLTIQYSVPDRDVLSFKSESTSDVRVVDKGGFYQLEPNYPQWDTSTSQTDPQLQQRALQAAWLSNVYAMKMMNITSIRQSDDAKNPLVFNKVNSTFDRGFPLGTTSCLGMTSPEYISNEPFGCFAPRSLNSTFNLTKDVSSDYLSGDIKYLCSDNHNPVVGNIGNIGAYCALMLGAAQRVYGTDESPIAQPGSKWSKPMYSCAMAAEAIIKTVKFSFNATDSLRGLAVLDIKNKTYPDGSEPPLWGVENLGYDNHKLTPLWGLLSENAFSTVGKNKLQTVRKESLLLPSGASASYIFSSYQNMPANEFYMRGFGVIDDMYLGDDTLPDYTGKVNLAMARRWSELSGTPESMATILKLIWTDFAANAVVRTKGAPRTNADNSPKARKRAVAETQAITRPVSIYKRKIQYRLAYAVPAMIVLGCLFLIAVFIILALLFGRTSLRKIKRSLNATSAGRIMTATLHLVPPKVDNESSSSTWIKEDGRTVFIAGKHKVVLVGTAVGGEEGALLAPHEDSSHIEGKSLGDE